MERRSPVWDYLIVGAGSAGCVLANRLSENPRNRVLLIEAGPPDRNPFLHIPKGFVRTLGDPRHVWHHRTEASCPGGNPEVWPRGRTLGGSSAVNGMMYVKGHPQDYDDWKAQGLSGWGWDEIGPAFAALEHNGLSVSHRPEGNLETWDALIAAGMEMGLPVRDDLNAGAGPGIGFLPATIGKGWRSSAATAFLHPIRNRTNLSVCTGLTVERVTFSDQTATGVVARRADGSEDAIQARETILSAGAIESPLLLQRSGVGPAKLLARLGLPVIADCPGVGENLIEHRLLGFQYRLRRGGDNAWLRGAGLGLSIARYLALRSGPIATGAYQVGAFVSTQACTERPDAELLMGAYSIDLAAGGMTMERAPGMRIITFPMRPRSLGHVRLISPDNSLPPSIFANYLADPYDQAVSIASARFIRQMARQPALAGLIVEECLPGAKVESDEEIIEAFRHQGVAGMHASSTCRMGTDDRSVVDARLRVRGIDGLRVMDCSVLPSMVSGNTNGPVMAMAWNGARIIMEDAGRA